MPRRVWRVCYPCGIHFLISQIVARAAVNILLYSGGDVQDYQSLVVMLTGITGLLVMIPCTCLYRSDRRARISGGLLSEKRQKHLNFGEGILIFCMGIGFSQFANILVGLFQNLLHYQQYQETMDQITLGKSLLTLIFWMGIIAPLAEEIVFRWLIYLRLRDYMKMGAAIVISAAFFGIYHMNLVQAVYAGILGAVFAYFLELTGSIWASVLLHMGSNIWSLVFTEAAPWLLEKYPAWILVIYAVLLCTVIAGTAYFQRKQEHS